MITKLKQIEDLLIEKPIKKLAIVAAHDDNILESAKEVYQRGYGQLILIGDKKKIFQIAKEINFDLSMINIVEEADYERGAKIAVEMAHNGEAHVVMKGLLSTAEFMKAVLNRETGLRTNKLISNTIIIENENYHKLLMLSDAAINIEPDLMQKADIIRNSVDIAHKLGIEKPKVAILSAVEVVNPSMKSTMDGALLSQMCKRGQIKGCIVDGPLSMDLAISKESVKHKKIESEVAGDADILIAPNIDVANILVKSLAFLQNNTLCHIITGTKAPIVVTSRSDTPETKYYSMLMALAMC